MTSRIEYAALGQAEKTQGIFTQLDLLDDAITLNPPATTPATSEEGPLTSRAVLTTSGKGVDVDGMRLYSDSGDGAMAALQRIVSLLNDVRVSEDAGALEQEPVTLSAGGGRFDLPRLGVSIRVRGGAGGESRRLLAEIAELWRGTQSSTSPARGPAAAADALRFHRFHMAVAGTQLRLDHPSLKLSISVKGDGEPAAAAAWRLAQAWNMLEGWPSVAAADGALRDVDQVVHDLAQAFEAGNDCNALLAQLTQALRVRDCQADLTAGRTHDCARCMRQEE